MSETVKPTIAALRAWLKTCPLIADEQEATGAAFRIAGLEEESTAFSIEDSPGDPIITEYISGWEMAKNYLFLSRREYSEVDAVSIQNSGFFEQLTEWVMQQDARHNLPDLSACGGGKTPTGIAVTNSGYIVTNSAGSCKMQLQMRLTYYMPTKGAVPMSTQTEPKLVTQIDFARAGQITPQMKEVAEREHRDPEYIRERVADGRIAIPANIVHIKKGMRAFGVGEGLSTKVNVNLGISGDKADAAEEWKKVKIAENFGADAIMDLSNSGKTRQFRQQLIDETPLMVGTVPMYDAIGYMEKPLVKLTKDDLFEVVRAHAEDGVDFMTIHCGINKSVTKTFKETGRLMNIVSRGGSLLFGWMEVTGNENPFYEFYDELLEICHEYDVTISLGDSCRPGCLYDSNDATETAEMIELGKLCKRAWAAGVQVMVEGPGHMALDEIAANMKLQKRLCHNAPFYVLGPLVTDIGVGYDHITAAIGGAISASSGADFLCYVTPAEHLCLPNAQDVLDGLMATKIAAHAADIAKKVPHARDMDDKMGQARRKLDWDAMWKCALDPVTGKKRYEESPAATEGTCTMCGKMCAVRTVNKVFEGTTIDLGMED